MITPDSFKSSEVVAGFPAALRVARMGFTNPEDYRALVGDAEWAHATRFDGQRRIEHLAGRAAARAALAALLGPTHATIVAASDGAPEVCGVDDPPCVSISHGRHGAIAAVGHVACLGIDLCDLDDAARVRRVAGRFLHADELALARDDRDWLVLWALKEAGAKALRTGLLEGGLRATRVVALAPPRFGSPALESCAVTSDRDVIAVAYRQHRSPSGDDVSSPRRPRGRLRAR